MSDTPRTDKAEFEVFDGQNLAAVVESEFARKLERELNEACKIALNDPGLAVVNRYILSQIAANSSAPK
jgi:hypothetical protein